jgi:hypothetical protein
MSEVMESQRERLSFPKRIGIAFAGGWLAIASRTVVKDRRILFINDAFGLSGSVISLGHILEGFVKSGHKLLVINKKKDKGAAHLRQGGATVFRIHISIGLSAGQVAEEWEKRIGLLKQS